MATYNGARYLDAQLQSLAQQALKPAELIICDDRSTDATPEIARAFARRAPFPVLFQVNPRRLHFADNFLRAAGLCSSSHIAFCDQDDIWHPQKLAKVARASDITGACLVAHHFTDVDATGKPLGKATRATGDRLLTGAELHPWGFHFGFSCTFRRELLDLVPAQDRPIDLIDPTRPLAHDRWVAFLASVYGTTYVFGESLANYRHHASNASGWMRDRHGLVTSLRLARHRSGYHLLRHLTVSRGLVAALRSLLADQSRRELLPSTARLTEMLAYWTVYVDRCAARYHILEQDRWSQRALRLTRALSADAYRDAVDGSFSYHHVIHDLVTGLLAQSGQYERAEALLASGVR